MDRLAHFVRLVRPPGWWRGLPGVASRESMLWTAFAWVCGNVGVFGVMFGLGYVVFGRPEWGVPTTLLGLAALVVTIGALGRTRTHARARGAGGGGRGGCLRREPVNGAGTSVRDVVRRRRGLELVATGA